MNIQLVIVLILFAIAVFVTGRKLIHTFGKNKTPGCEKCSPEQIKSVRK